jgi:hypothetical protein
VLTLSDKETWGVWEKRAQRIDQERKKNLEGERKTPCHVSRCEGEGQSEPVGYAEASDTVCCYT